ncbi:MAG: cell division control protein Cdc6, partial [Halobacteriaceae archaeon]
LSMQTLEFTSYNTQQLIDILEKRVEKAFRPGAVPEEVIERIAEAVADQSGDCRQALDRLLRIGRKAEQESLSEISEEMLG